MSSSEVHPLYAFLIESARDPLTDEVDTDLLLPRSMMVPKNSGVQTIYAAIKHALARAKRFKEPFRSIAIEIVKADLGGMLSISSELGAMVKEFGTTRTSVPIGQITGQPVTDLDVYLQEQVMGNKGLLKNNPRDKSLGLGGI